MTTPSPFQKSDIQERPSTARLAAEALFTASRTQEPRDGPTAQVFVKRRRKLEVDGIPPAPEKHVADPLQERAPRTHLLSASVSKQAERSGLEHPPRLSGVSEGRPKPRRRMRRELNGAVTIVRPIDDDPDASSGANDHPGKRGLHPQSPLFPQQWPTSLRYPRLLVQIRALEQEALALKQRQGALRWITSAIQQYGLTATDVGL